MQTSPESLVIDPYPEDADAITFCEAFLRGGVARFVFGRNEYAKSIASVVDIDGFIDDFTTDAQYEGKPIVPAHALPKNALVVSAVVLGRPITALRRIREEGMRGLSYFAFQKYSGLALKDVHFLDRFKAEYFAHRDHYEWIAGLLADVESQRIFRRLVNFRLSRDLTYMEGFVDAQFRQYFEGLLDLKPSGEIFLDVGSFDGYTSQEFARRCPDYRAIHTFEPEPANMARVKARLAGFSNVFYHSCGCSDRTQTLKFKVRGSASQICKDGDSVIRVERIDDVVSGDYTFLKMDIEGGEIPALEGAGDSIKRCHPKLAISVYHHVDDLWRVPSVVLRMRSDYKIYLRHYTEGVDETVMFFIPERPLK